MSGGHGVGGSNPPSPKRESSAYAGLFLFVFIAAAYANAREREFRCPAKRNQFIVSGSVFMDDEISLLAEQMYSTSKNVARPV